jgi:sugar/nucleoside kinase (ribokinase family)
VLLDVVCAALPAPGERRHAGVAVRAGGTAVNVASAAAAAGAAASVVGRIGQDAAGDLVLAELGARSVEANLARDAVLPTGVAVAYAADGSPPAVVASRGANAAFTPEDVPAAIDADALFVSGFALFQQGSAAAAELALRRCARGWIGIDVGSPTLAAAARDALPASPPERAARTVVFATAAEARALTGEEPEPAARTLAAGGLLACVKLGRDGAVVASRDRVERRAAPPVERRSPFGAGDAFAGSFLVALAAGAGVGAALERACDAGARAAARRD